MLEVFGVEISGWIVLAWFVYLVAIIVWVILQKREPAATLAWIMALAALPVIGFVIFYVFGPRRIKRQRLRRGGSTEQWEQSVGKHEALAASDAPHELLVQQTQMVETACQMPLTTASSVELLVDGAVTYDALCKAIAGAQHHVHLEYYIFGDDETGTRIRDALVERAKAGVEVRLLIDGAGSFHTEKSFMEPLEDAGGELAIFHHVYGIAGFRPHFNFRSHRKMMIVDGTVAFTGGINITDDENPKVKPSDYFHDLHLRMEGGVANYLQRVFLEDWHYATKKMPDASKYVRVHPPGEFALQVLASGPDCHWEPTHRAFVNAIHSARDRVWLMTPYFVPSEAALMALTSAAMRGVDVRVMVPDKNDSIVVKLAARSFYESVIEAGVRVFEYQPRMLHCKAMLVDDAFVLMGTSNFDSRSFRLNFEVDVAIHEKEIASALEKVWEADEALCVEVHKLKEPLPFGVRLKQATARLAAPLL